MAGELIFFKKHFWLCGKLDFSTIRLLEISESGELDFTKDLKDNIPIYAILLHAWGREDEEVEFNDLMTGFSKDKQGYLKIQFCQEQAYNDRIHKF